MDATEWTLKPVLSQKFVENFGKSNIDPFATKFNKQLNSYLFWHPEPEAVANNTLLPGTTIVSTYFHLSVFRLGINQDS